MTGLETKLRAILEDKELNLLPENLRKDVVCLGVTGTYGEGQDINSKIVFNWTDPTVESYTDGPYDLSSKMVVGTNVSVYKGVDDNYYMVIPKENNYQTMTYNTDVQVFTCTVSGYAFNMGRSRHYRLDANQTLTYIGEFHANASSSSVKNYLESPKVAEIIYSNVDVVKLESPSTIIFPSNGEGVDYTQFGIGLRYISIDRAGLTYYNTASADITNEDVVSGKIAYGVDGEIVGCNDYNVVIDGTLNASDNLMSIIHEIKGEIQLGSRTSCAKFFHGCKNLIEPPIMNTSNITSMSQMHEYNSKLIKGGEYNTSNVTTMFFMYSSCSALMEIPEYDAGNVKDVDWFVHGCSALTTFGGLLDLGKAYSQQTENYSKYILDLSATNVLTLESAINALTKLYDLNLTYDVANGGTLYRQKVKLHSTVLANLQATEEGLQALANANAKGWDVTSE